MKRFVPILFLALASCSTYSKKECSAMDWSSQGYLAAIDGKQRNESLSHYREKCGSEHGVNPDEGGFGRGYEAGLEVLCTQTGGMELGAKGLPYAKTCPEGKEKDFLGGYTAGRLDYTNKRISQLEEEVRRLRRQLDDRERTIMELQARLRRTW